MPRALVHLHPESGRVLGVWLDPFRSAYLNTRDSGYAKTVGADVVDNKKAAISWDDYVDLLAEQWPSVAIWQSVPRADGEEPRHVLARMVATEAVEQREREE